MAPRIHPISTPSKPVWAFQIATKSDMVRLGMRFARAVQQSEDFKRNQKAVIGIDGIQGMGKTTFSDGFKKVFPAIAEGNIKSSRMGQFSYQAAGGMTIARHDLIVDKGFIPQQDGNAIHILEHANRLPDFPYTFLCAIYFIQNGQPVQLPTQDNRQLLKGRQERYIEIIPQNGQEHDTAFTHLNRHVLTQSK